MLFMTLSHLFTVFFLFYFILLTFAPVAGDILFRSTRCRTKCHTVKAEIPLSPSILLCSPAACQAGSQKHLCDIPPAAASDSVSSVCCHCTLCYYILRRFFREVIIDWKTRIQRQVL